MIDEQKQLEEIQLLEKLFEFVIPKYKEAHDIMVSMLDFEQTQEIRVADLGCGFGDLTTRIIDSFPLSLVFGFDNQPKILERTREKLRESLDQLFLYERDLNDSTWMNEMNHLDAVVSSFTLDYLASERHRAVLKEAFDLLHPGGRWVSCEFFRSDDNRVNRVFHDVEITFIQNALKNGDVTEAHVEQLGLSAILRQDHHIITVGQKVEWLKEIGFRYVEAPWRFLNLAVISGVR
jgi:ubiquinone/menaquinone biosynthesis C-methylase UbiE